MMPKQCRIITFAHADLCVDRETCLSAGAYLVRVRFGAGLGRMIRLIDRPVYLYLQERSYCRVFWKHSYLLRLLTRDSCVDGTRLKALGHDR